MIYFASIIAIIFLILGYLKPRWTIYFIAVGLPAYLLRFDAVGLPFTILEVAIMAMFVGWFISIIKKPKQNNLLSFVKKAPKQTTLFLYLGLTLIIIAAFSAYISPAGLRAWGVWKAYFVEPFLLFIVVISVFEKKHLKYIIAWLGAGAFYTSLVAIVQYFTGWGMPMEYLTSTGNVDRVVGFFSYPNALGLYLGPIIILLFYFILNNHNRFIKFLSALTITLSFITIVMAKSEGAVVAVIISVLLLLTLNKKTRITGLILIGVSIVMAVGLIYFQPLFIDKIMLNDYSGFVRRLIWQETNRLLKYNTLLGAGLAGYPITVIPHHLPSFEIFLYPHNIVLNFWVELGLAGVIIMTTIFVVFFWQNICASFFSMQNKSKKHKTLLSLVLLATMTAIIIHGMVDVPYFKNDLSVLFWMIIAISVINSQNVIKS